MSVGLSNVGIVKRPSRLTTALAAEKAEKSELAAEDSAIQAERVEKHKKSEAPAEESDKAAEKPEKQDDNEGENAAHQEEIHEDAYRIQEDTTNLQQPNPLEIS